MAGFAYVDWERILSFDAPITFVMTARNRGKSYGIRLQCLKDWEKDGSMFVNLYRTKDDRKELKLQFLKECQAKIPEFRNYIFQTVGNAGYIAKPVGDGEKPEWREFCLFMVIGDEQRTKQHMISNVKRIIFDETLITKNDPNKRYLPNEWVSLSNMFSTLSRQLPFEKTKCRLYLLCNSCGLFNPYFQALGIKDDPPYGERWFSDSAGKFILFYNEKPPEGWVESIETTTIAGRMLAMTDEGHAMNANTFAGSNTDYISKKPADSEFQCAVKWGNTTYGIWLSWENGYYYVNRKTPKSTKKKTYVLKKEDNGLNYVLAKKSAPVFQALAEAVYQSLIMYDSQATQNGFFDVLKQIGVM